METLFEINGNKIYDYDLWAIDNAEYEGFLVEWTGSKGFGSFAYRADENNKQELETECMGRDFCSKFMKHIFAECEVDYKDEN